MLVEASDWRHSYGSYWQWRGARVSSDQAEQGRRNQVLPLLEVLFVASQTQDWHSRDSDR